MGSLRPWGLAVAVGCGAPPEVDPLAADEAARSLARASLDLRGVRPAAEELAVVRDDPSRVVSLVGTFVDDPAFGLRYAQHMSGVWGTPVTQSDHEQATYPVEDIFAMLESIGQEPLRVLAHIADSDLPYTEFVTGDWTVLNEELAAFYPSDYPEGGTGWKVVHYTDGRPSAGVLTTNGLWWRYDSTQANANRGRANATSRILLCRDYLQVNIEGDRDLDLLDEAAVQDALRTAEACVTCHAGLDPLASFYWGFYNHFNFSPAEQATYHPERELDWEDHNGVPPAYYGEPGQTLTDLGRFVAADPRYIECAVERTWEQLMSRPARLEDSDALLAHREAFLSSRLTLRELVRSVVTDDRYLSAGAATADGKLVTPDLYASQVEDLTGFRFRIEDRDAIATDLLGMRTLGGGLGASFDGDPIVAPTPTAALVFQRIAEAAAAHALEDGRSVLAGDFDTSVRADDPGFADQLDGLFVRVLSLPADRLPIDAAVASELWRAVEEETGSTAASWAAVLAWLLRHPDFLVY